MNGENFITSAYTTCTWPSGISVSAFSELTLSLACLLGFVVRPTTNRIIPHRNNRKWEFVYRTSDGKFEWLEVIPIGSSKLNIRFGRNGSSDFSEILVNLPDALAAVLSLFLTSYTGRKAQHEYRDDPETWTIADIGSDVYYMHRFYHFEGLTRHASKTTNNTFL